MRIRDDDDTCRDDDETCRVVTCTLARAQAVVRAFERMGGVFRSNRLSKEEIYSLAQRMPVNDVTPHQTSAFTHGHTSHLLGRSAYTGGVSALLKCAIRPRLEMEPLLK